MKQFIAPALLLLAFSLVNCKKEQEDDSTRCPAEMGPPPAGYKTLLSIKSQRDPTGEVTYSLSVSDNVQYPCTNYRLKTIRSRKDNELVISVCDALQVGTCTSGTANAVGSVSINEYIKTNQALRINVRGKETTGRLNLASQPYSIVLQDTTYAAPRP